MAYLNDGSGSKPATVCCYESIFLHLTHLFIIKHSLIEYLPSILDDDAAIAVANLLAVQVVCGQVRR